MSALLRAALPILLACQCAHAADLVTLRSGFTVECARRETLPSGAVRLFLRGNAAESNYMDVSPSAIAAVEAMPEVSTPAPVTQRTAAKPRETPALSVLVSRSGSAHNVNTALLAAVIYAESSGNARAVSRTGARGLMQLMPATASALGVSDSFSPAENVDGGSAYLDALLTRYHDNLPLAVAAYNAGPNAVDRYHGIPPYRETRLYVARVIREFNRLATSQAGTRR